MDEVEEPLYGGLEDGRVVRVGDTVRRPAGAWTPTIHALLAHLKGREMLTFLPGVCSTRPWPAALLTDDGACQVGALARAYHHAVADFTPPSPAIWRHGPQGLAPGEIVLHGDFAPHNLIWTDGRLTGVIDFELARPGRALEDAAFAVIRVAHLRPDDMAPATGLAGPPDRRARLVAFALGYGVRVQELLGEALTVQAGELARIERFGGAGVEPWATFLRRGLAAQVKLELAWMLENLGRLASG